MVFLVMGILGDPLKIDQINVPLVFSFIVVERLVELLVEFQQQ